MEVAEWRSARVDQLSLPTVMRNARPEPGIRIALPAARWVFNERVLAVCNDHSTIQDFVKLI